MSINITELRKAMNARNEHEQAVAEYIVWQLAAMENEALAETTANEIIGKVFKLSDAVKAVSDLARKNGGGVSDQAGYKAVREYLHIDGAVSDAEAALYFLRDIPKETVIELINKIKRDDPAVTKPMLDLGLDDLFG